MNKFLPYFSKVMFCLLMLTLGTTSTILVANNANLDSANLKEKTNTPDTYTAGSFFPDFESSEANQSLSAVTCNTSRTCRNGKIYTEKKVGYDCITVVIIPSCSGGKTYDASTCSCKHQTTHSNPPSYSSCNKVCDKTWCESDGTKYKQVLDRNSCSCYTVRAAKVNCGYGEVFDKNSCKCVKKQVVPAPCNIRCDSRILCDGKGNLTKKILDDKNCQCKTVSVAKPSCPTGKVYSTSNCGCIAKPTTSSNANCQSVKVTASNGTINITGLSAPQKVVKVFDANWKTVYSCSGNCKETEVIKNMHGTYYVHANFTIQLGITSVE